MYIDFCEVLMVFYFRMIGFEVRIFAAIILELRLYILDLKITKIIRNLKSKI